MRRADLEHVIRRVGDLPLPRPQRSRIERLLRDLGDVR